MRRLLALDLGLSLASDMDDEFALFAAEIGELAQEPGPEPVSPAPPPQAAVRSATIAKAPAHVPAGPSLPPPLASAPSGQARAMATQPFRPPPPPAGMYGVGAGKAAVSPQHVINPI